MCVPTRTARPQEPHRGDEPLTPREFCITGPEVGTGGRGRPPSLCRGRGGPRRTCLTGSLTAYGRASLCSEHYASEHPVPLWVPSALFLPGSPVPCVSPGSQWPACPWVPSALFLPWVPSALFLPRPPVPCVSRVPSALRLPESPVPSVFLGAQCPVPSQVPITLCLPGVPCPLEKLPRLSPTQPAPCSRFISPLSLKLLLCRPSQLTVDGGRNLLRLISCF